MSDYVQATQNPWALIFRDDLAFLQSPAPGPRSGDSPVQSSKGKSPVCLVPTLVPFLTSTSPRDREELAWSGSWLALAFHRALCSCGYSGNQFYLPVA